MAKRGRKGYEEELKRKNLISLSYKILEQALKSTKVDATEKRRIALEVIKRRIPTEQVVIGDFTHTEKQIMIVYEKDKNKNNSSRLTKEDIGAPGEV